MQLFGEALLVPVNEWDGVKSLGEFEDGSADERGVPQGESEEGQLEMGDVPAHPQDPFPFDGHIR